MTKKNMGLRYMMTGGAVILASGLGTAGVASAATSHAATTITVTLPAAGIDRPDGGPGAPMRGPQAPLTGATLASAVASATAAVPNATVLRSEAGPHGTYVVHFKKSDGTYVTLVENASFVVTSTHADSGPGPSEGPGSLGDPATMTHGPGETLLTGTTLTSAEASATTAVPNATVIRAESDAQGAAYEVHMKKADGTDVTVKENASFVVTSTQSRLGAAPERPANAQGEPERGPRPGMRGPTN